MHEDSRFLTVSETAQLLHLSPQSVYARVARGDLDAVRVGHGPKAPIRIAPAELVEYLRKSSS